MDDEKQKDERRGSTEERNPVKDLLTDKPIIIKKLGTGQVEVIFSGEFREQASTDKDFVHPDPRKRMTALVIESNFQVLATSEGKSITIALGPDCVVSVSYS